jgi:hypothetical protein
MSAPDSISFPSAGTYHGHVESGARPCAVQGREAKVTGLGVVASSVVPLRSHTRCGRGQDVPSATEAGETTPASGSFRCVSARPMPACGQAPPPPDGVAADTTRRLEPGTRSSGWFHTHVCDGGGEQQVGGVGCGAVLCRNSDRQGRQHSSSSCSCMIAAMLG